MNTPQKPMRITPYFHNGTFSNYPGEKQEKWFFHSLELYVKSLFRSSSHTVAATWTQCPEFVATSLYPRITWLGHSSFLIQIAGLTIITDPVFARISYFFKRLLPLLCNLKDLPEVTIVLLSHNHPDHMDPPSLKKLHQLFPNLEFLVPSGDKAWFTAHGMQKTTEFTWWESWQKNDITFTFLPAHHWSQRRIFKRNTSLWGSWMLQTPYGTLYFAGDTGYWHHFKNIAHYFPSIDIALIPIGPCEPHHLMRNSHLNAEEAGQAFLELQASHFIPMHWGTYRFFLGHDTFSTPIDRLMSWWHHNRELLHTRSLHIPKVGQNIALSSEMLSLQSRQLATASSTLQDHTS